MSDDSVAAQLAIMRQERDERLPQYVAYLHQPTGWSLRQIGNALGTSREWARILELRGMTEIGDEGRKDLTGLPAFTPHKARKPSNPTPAAMPPATVALLKAMNADAQKYRHGHDSRHVVAFNTMVENLLDSGVQLNTISRAIGQTPGGFRNRMARWGVSPSNSKKKTRSLTLTAMEEGQVKEAEKAPSSPTGSCDDPTCPVRGAHQHG